MFTSNRRQVAAGILFSTLITVGTVNCAGEKVKPASISQSADPSAEIARLNDGLNQAEAEGINAYSPKNFKYADESLQDARKLREKSADAHKILEKVAMGDAYLERAKQLSQISQASLGIVPEMRDAALKADAKAMVPDQFKQVEGKLMDVTKKVEDGNTSDAAKKSPELARDYENLRVNAVTEAHLGKAKSLLETAKKENAEKLAPDALSRAEREFNSAHKMISQNPDNLPEIQTRAEAATDSAMRALEFTREAKLIQERPPEFAVSQLEQKNEALSQLNEEQKKTEEELAKSGQTMQKLQSKTALEDKYNQISSQFQPTEADVLRQGNQIIIRLKGLTFKKGSSSFTAKDLALLKKVGDSVQPFEGDSKIVVQGNTDSTGSPGSNQKLSEKRAESVKDYLVTHTSLPPQKVSAQGFSSSQPIASNKTEKGRAENRRVDVVIEAVT